MADIDGFQVALSELGYTGHDLSRPECIVAQPDGTLWVSDNRAALTRIAPDGTQQRIGAIGGAPNGIAMDGRGRICIANIDDGKVYRLEQDGRHEVLLERIDDGPLGAVNFVMFDEQDRMWITVSTRTEPRSRAIAESIPDGYVLRIDREGEAPRRIASGFRFTNEVRIDAAQRYLYVAETAIGAVTRLPLRADGTAGDPEAFGPRPLFPGAKVDGITFDADGNLWVTEITRNAIFVLRPDGGLHEVVSDPDGRALVLPTSITFCGPDLRTVVVGSLKMDRLATFRSPVPGAPLRHWKSRPG
jgi:gluconolactonase